MKLQNGDQASRRGWSPYSWWSLIPLLPPLLTSFLTCWPIAREQGTLGENPGFSVGSHSSSPAQAGQVSPMVETDCSFVPRQGAVPTAPCFYKVNPFFFSQFQSQTSIYIYVIGRCGTRKGSERTYTKLFWSALATGFASHFCFYLIGFLI